MSNLSVVIGADTTGLTRAISSAQDVLNKYVSTSKSASAEIRKNANVTESQVTAFKRVVDALEKVNSGSMTTAQQQKALKTQITELRAQWEGLSNEARQSDFGKAMSASLSSAQQQLTNVTNTIKQVTGDMGGRKELPLKGQLKRLTIQLTELTAKYRAMSQAEKESAGGRELAAKMDELREKAGVLQDTIGDVKSEIAVMASDTPNLDVFNDLLGLSADTLQTYSGFLAKVTGDEEALKDMISTVIMVQGAANTMTKLTNAIQSSSTIMLKTRAIQEGAAAMAIKVRTAAEGKGIIATKAATIAQRAFNLVAKANPYILLATAVIAVSTALYAFSRNIGKAKDEEENLNDTTEKAKTVTETLADAHKEANENMAAGIVKVNALYAAVKNSNQAYEDRKKALDKLKSIVPDYHGDLTTEGKLINDNTGAIDNYIRHLAAMAKAQSYMNKLIAAETDVLNANDRIRQLNINKEAVLTQMRKMEANGTAYETVYTGVGTGQRYESTVRTDAYQKQVDAYNQWNSEIEKEKKNLNKANQVVTRIERDIQNNTDINSAFNSIITDDNSGGGRNSSGGRAGTTKSGKNDNLEVLNGSIADLEGKLRDLQSRFNAGQVSKEDYAKQYKELSDALNAKKEERDALENNNKSIISQLEEQIKSKQESLEVAIEVDPESIPKIQEEIQSLTAKKRMIEIELMPYGIEKFEEQLKLLNDMREYQISQPDYNTNPERQQIVQNINTQIEDIEKQKLELKLEINKDANERELGKQLHTLVTDLGDAQSIPLSLQIQTYGLEKINELGAITTKPLVSVEDWSAQVDLLSNYIKKLEDLKAKMEEFGLTGTTAYKELLDVMSKWQGELDTNSEGLQNIIDLTKKTENLANQMSVLGSCISSTASAFTSLGTSFKLPVLNIVGIIAGAIATVLQGYATASAQSAAMGPIAWAAFSLAGLAQVAAVIGQIHSLSGYANGGIIKGATNIGDYNLARVNNGEMILNGSQQARLYKMATGALVPQSTGGGIGQVEFKIKGSTLVGAIDNYQKKISRY